MSSGGFFSDFMAVQLFEASIQKGIANNFCLCTLFLGPWSLFPFFTKFSFLSFTTLGLGLHQDVLIRNFLSEDLFFKCGKRLVKGWCCLAADTQSFLFVLRFWNFLSLLREEVTFWPKKWSFWTVYWCYFVWASVTQTCLNCGSWSCGGQERSFWIKNTTLFSS